MDTLRLALATALALAAMPAFAQSAGDFTVAIGAHNVDPTSDNGTVAGALKVRVGNSARPTIAGEYFLRDRLGLEVLAALPFQHDISIDGIGKVGSTKHLPPTISLQYHFGSGKVRPFVGAGLNYTIFFSEKTEGALAGSDLNLKSSFGLAAHAGLDFQISEKSAIRVDARWMDIDTEAKLDGEKIGTVNIDPMVYGVAYVLKF